MKFEKQRETFCITDALETLTTPQSSYQRHGRLLPNSIRCIICGPSNCGKTNILYKIITDGNDLRFANLYVFSKSLHQPKYVLLSEILDRIPECGFFTYDDKDAVISPDEALNNSIIIFDDVACDSQDRMKEFFSMGRHRGVDCFYLTQTYARIPKHLLRDNANLIFLFKQDDLNLKHVYTDHVGTDMTFNQFKELCAKCWKRDEYGFVVINKDCELNKGRYRCGLDTFVTGI